MDVMFLMRGEGRRGCGGRGRGEEGADGDREGVSGAHAFPMPNVGGK